MSSADNGGRPLCPGPTGSGFLADACACVCRRQLTSDPGAPVPGSWLSLAASYKRLLQTHPVRLKEPRPAVSLSNSCLSPSHIAAPAANRRSRWARCRGGWKECPNERRLLVVSLTPVSFLSPSLSSSPTNLSTNVWLLFQRPHSCSVVGKLEQAPRVIT